VARSGGPELLRRRCRATGVEMRPIHSGTLAERGKPVVSPCPLPMGSRESNPQGAPTGQQVKEERESECRAVMVRIGVERQAVQREEQRKVMSPCATCCDIILRRRPADFSLVWRHERTWQTDFRGRRRYVGSGNACWCGPQSWQHGLSAPGEYREGFFRQAKAGRFWAIRPHRGCNSVAKGVDHSPHGRPGSSGIPTQNRIGQLATRRWSGYTNYRQPRRRELEREKPRSGRGVSPGLSCMHRNGARTVLRGLGGSNVPRLPDLQKEAFALL
jgi:hypothetical protein